MVASKKGKETPAEQLLRMIEGSRAPEPSAPGRPAALPRLRVGQLWQEFTGRLLRGILPGDREADAFLWNLRLAYRIMWVALAGLGAYVVVDVLLIQPKPRFTHATVLSTKEAAIPAVPAMASGDALGSLADYLAAMKQRNPFTGREGDTDAPAVKRTTKVALADLVANLVIVGIDRGASPMALIESSSEKRTYMVKVGDEINGMVVKKIGTEGVLLSYEGEELLLQ
ncbi:MAG: hypothetical protein HYZ91_05030 [Candidatus Omnitrophica bacterium]|nr:hypothetical protein [Candidatus Omnitrophota bacterium]